MVKHHNTVQMFVVAERQVVCEVETVWEGLRSMFGVYFAFNLEYAKQHRPLLIFIQHYVFNIKDSQSIPNLVKQIKSSVDKISVV